MLITTKYHVVGMSLWWVFVRMYSLAVMPKVSRNAQFRAQEDWKDVYNIG